MQNQKIARLSLFLALSVFLSFLETLLPLGVVPGVKLGLANIPILLVLYLYSFWDACLLTFLKVLFVSLFQTGLFSFGFYLSFMGSMMAIVVAGLFYRTKLSVKGVSILSSVTHSCVQVMVSSFLLQVDLLYYVGIVCLLSIVTGYWIGFFSESLYEKLKDVR